AGAPLVEPALDSDAHAHRLQVIDRQDRQAGVAAPAVAGRAQLAGLAAFEQLAERRGRLRLDDQVDGRPIRQIGKPYFLDVAQLAQRGQRRLVVLPDRRLHVEVLDADRADPPALAERGDHVVLELLAPGEDAVGRAGVERV